MYYSLIYTQSLLFVPNCGLKFVLLACSPVGGDWKIRRLAQEVDPRWLPLGLPPPCEEPLWAIQRRQATSGTSEKRIDLPTKPDTQ